MGGGGAIVRRQELQSPGLFLEASERDPKKSCCHILRPPFPSFESPKVAQPPAPLPDQISPIQPAWAGCEKKQRQPLP
jgi:hypothetical protein